MKTAGRAVVCEWPTCHWLGLLVCHLAPAQEAGHISPQTTWHGIFRISLWDFKFDIFHGPCRRWSYDPLNSAAQFTYATSCQIAAILLLGSKAKPP